MATPLFSEAALTSGLITGCVANHHMLICTDIGVGTRPTRGTAMADLPVPTTGKTLSGRLHVSQKRSLVRRLMGVRK